jgi:hypothetical protein
MNAATTETATTDDRKKAQDAYDTAKAELATLKPTRTVGELEAMRAGWRRAYPNQPERIADFERQGRVGPKPETKR